MHQCMDYHAHNAEVKEVLDAYRQGNPIRVPCIIAMNVRMVLLDPKLNPEKVTFRDYLLNPDVMLQQRLKFEEWSRTEMMFDHEMGLPDRWVVGVDYQNIYEAAWFGCEVHFNSNNCPCTRVCLTDDTKWRIIDRGLPDPIDDSNRGGWMKRSWEFWDYWKSLRDTGFEYRGLPIDPSPHFAGTDGPFTVAMNLRGENLCIDMMEDPDYFHALLALVTEGIILRCRTILERTGQPLKMNYFGFADDSIILLSTEQYREFVKPYHERLIGALAEGERPKVSVHLCGNAQRYYTVMARELNAKSFDTGFPIDFGRLREEVGPDVEIQGGPKVDLLREGPVEAIEAETKRILQSGIMHGGRFIIKEANNLAPCTPPEHIHAFYQAVKKWGRYS